MNFAGISGYVKSITGEPLPTATLNMDGDELPIPLSPTTAFFHHVVPDGAYYHLTASATGRYHIQFSRLALIICACVTAM